MTLWNPEYRVKVNGYTVTSATLAGMTVTSGRTDIYAQPQAGYCNLSLLETNESSVTYEINMPLTVEVKDSNGVFVYLFGGFISDLNIEVATSGSTALSQRINIVAVGALARLARAIFEGNIASDYDGDQIYTILSGVLFDTWDEVPAATTWNDYDPTVTWANAENSGLGEIDQPGDYQLDSQSNVLNNVYAVVSGLATSGLGYIYEDSQGRIGYADSTHRSQYLAANGYVDLDGNHATGSGLNIVKRAGDVRNSITITYGSAGNQSVTDTDPASITDYGQLAATVSTTLKNQADAESQAAFYLDLRAYPQFLMNRITFEVGSPEIDDADRDALLNVFMGLPLNIQNLPSNMVGGEFQGFVEGWTWRAGYNRLTLDLNVSPIAYSLQAFRWNNVPATETWNTLSPTLTWLDATIVS
jgi:hypothetical protein